MKRNQIFEKLNEVFRDVFDDEDITVTDATTAKDVDGWDSLMHITLISEVEDAFDIHFEMKDVTKMQNVGEMVDKILSLPEGTKIQILSPVSTHLCRSLCTSKTRV